MFDEKTMKVFYEVFDASLPRLAPGDDGSTRRALEALYGPELAGAGAGLRVLDMGCGTGTQTLRLATELDCRVTAVDNHAPYLAELHRRAVERGLTDRIETRCADMKEMNPGNEEFDLVWAEGSAFVLGIAGALARWHGFLAPGAALGFSDLVWLRGDAPAECHTFFGEEYPAIDDVATVLEWIAECGYDAVEHFALPESSWWEPFYRLLGKRVDELEGKFVGDETAGTVLAMCRREIEMYRKYSSYYGYVFFLVRKRA